MTPKMVANFRRSLSFPNNPPSSSFSSSSSSSKPKKTFHVRSTSLPCRPHDPLVFQLKDAINELKTWGSSSSCTTTTSGSADDHSRTSSWLCAGLAQLKLVHESLDDLLQLPQTRESLFGYSDHHELIEKFLEDFLHFVDVYGIFQTLVLRLKEEHLAAQVALRKRDDSKMQIYLNSLKKISKEMTKLVSAVQSTGKYTYFLVSDSTDVTGIIRDVIQVTVSVSVALFSGLAVSLSSTFSSHQKSSRIITRGGGFCLAKKNVVAKKLLVNSATTATTTTTNYQGFQEFAQIWLFQSLWNLRKKGNEELKLTSKRMHEIEDCIRGIEIGSEKAFRSLINTRVSLLNVLTQ